ncbi:MAG: PQQ-binding-like beta-propeller repeat protein [Verrucomicrobiae bacterium]|nr:PQQ-binding-like beta-propeller repeat protein [Verrucomicrobiae bacterium]
MKPVLAVALVLSTLALSLQARTWTQAASGRKIEAELIKVEGGKVHLRLPDGRIGEVEVASLSPDDQQFLVSESTKSTGSAASAGQWPAFRGPNGNGISPDKGLMNSWPSDGPAKIWTYDKAGMGYSGFSIVDGRLYTMGTRGDEVTVVCLDTSTGSEIWAKGISKDDQQGYAAGWGHGPRSTPTYSEGLVFAIDPKGVVACLNAEDGKEVWSKHLVNDFKGQMGGWGFAESPLVDGANLILAPGGKEAGMVALDKKSGDVVWKASELQPGKAEYATIIATEINGARQYVKLFENQIVGVSASDGKLLWSSPWGGKTAVIPTPIVDGNEIYVSSGYGVGCKLIRIGSDNTATDVWENKTMVNHHGGVIKVGDYLYGFSDAKGLICQDWKTGEMVWNEKGQFTLKGSVHVADDHIYALNEDDGTLTLVEVSSSGYKQKGQFKLDPQSPNRNPKGKVWTHPLVLGGKLYLRDQEYIVCYDVKG